MKVFADTLNWVARANPRDSWRQAVKQSRTKRRKAHIVTTEEILTEFFTVLAAGGVFTRGHATAIVHDILSDVHVTVIPQTRSASLAGFALYEAQPDKEYSLTDCISMNVMRAEGITDILTNDHHFAQEGFNVLIRR